jgi:DNA-binding transcriptional MerR regulator
VKLKRSYSAREVAARTGLSARQLQWWDARGLFMATVASRRTQAGGFTERRYSPIELYELLALADLRRNGFTVQKIRTILTVLRLKGLSARVRSRRRKVTARKPMKEQSK